MDSITLTELAGRTGAEFVAGERATQSVSGYADLASATPEEVSFFANRAYLAQLRRSQAGAVFVPRDFAEDLAGPSQLRVDNPSVAFAVAVEILSPPPQPFSPGIEDGASVHPMAKIDAAAVRVCAGAVIGEAVEIGAGSVIGGNVAVGAGARIGRDCVLHPNATVRERCVLGDRVILQPGAVIGSDGFGYEWTDGRHVKIEQRGIVQLDDDVEIGANATVDRARFGRTRIGEGTKVDNLVQIGHNVTIGRHCIVVALTGIAGSAVIGDHVVIAAQSGVAGHLKIGDGATLAARTGVVKSLPGGRAYSRFPAMPAGEAKRVFARERQLDDLFRRVRELERRDSR